MATVKALYDYSYDYEGSRITFRNGEEFQLLSKANTDWWHVRRWKDGAAQDIYVPAVYVKEEVKVEKDTNPTYENVAELRRRVRKAKEKAAKEEKLENGLDVRNDVAPPVGPKRKSDPSQDAGRTQPTPSKETHSPKPSPKHKPKIRQLSAPKGHESGGSVEGEKKIDGASKTTPEIQYAEPSSPPLASSPLVRKGSKEGNPGPVAGVPVLKGIKDGWRPGYALPVLAKPRSRSVNTEAVPPPSHSPRGGSPAPPTELTPNQPTSPTGSLPGVASRLGKVPPPVLPRVKHSERPKSMIVTSTSPTGLEPHYETVGESLKAVLGAKEPSARSGESVGGKIPTKPRPTSGNLGMRKTPSPKQVGADGPTKPPVVQNGGSLPRNTSPVLKALPEGWTEHKTGDGHIYYHNSLSGLSSWTRPQATSEESARPSAKSQGDPLEKIAPRGWTKEISLFSQTPVYTNCRTGERWALAKDSSGTYYYYNMANSSLTVGELPAINDLPTPTSTVPGRSTTDPANVYDRLNPSATESSKARKRLPSEPILDVPHMPSPKKSSLPTSVDVFTTSLANVLTQKKHGYLQRKRLHDAQGKKVKGGWQKMYVVLQDHQLHFYTDHKAAKETPGASPQFVFLLLQSTVSPYTKDKKRTIFQVSSSFGEQFLLQAETPPLMNDWYSTIQTTIDHANMDYRLHPEKYKGVVTGMEETGEQSPRNGTGGKSSSWKQGRKASTHDILYDDEDEDLMDDIEISAADKSVRIRSRLKKLMARRPQLEALKKSGIMEDPVFGCELAHLCEREKSNVPRFLLKFMDHIEKKGLDSVGLYRLSGNAASVQKLRFMVEADYTLIDLDDSEWADINIITGCLKLYLRELPEPVVPFRNFQGFIDAARLDTPQLRVAGIAARVKELPPANYHTLKTIIVHLRKVVEHGHINKMQSQNVAIVFGPTLMRPETDSIQMATLMAVQNGIVELMVTEFSSIFRK